MYIEFKTNKLKKCCENEKPRKRTWSEEIGKKLVQRLNEIVAAPNLRALKQVRSAKCHELEKDRKGQYAVKLTGNYRLIFKPVGETIEAQVIRVKILEVGDYH